MIHVVIPNIFQQRTKLHFYSLYSREKSGWQKNVYGGMLARALCESLRIKQNVIKKLCYNMCMHIKSNVNSHAPTYNVLHIDYAMLKVLVACQQKEPRHAC